MGKIKNNILYELDMIMNKDFNEIKFNDIDAFLLCMLAYMPFNQILNRDITNLEIDRNELKEKLEFFEPINKSKRKISDIICLKKVLSSKRYNKMIISSYLEKIDLDNEEQYSSITFIFDDFMYIAFGGTDASILGWKEDLNLALFEELPSQMDAILYSKMIMDRYNLKTYLGGHSKGGILAIYSAMNMDIDRIINIHSFDGPGFYKDIICLDNYIRIRDKIIKYVPKSSIIGLLFTNDINYKIIDAYSFSIAQHDPYQWKILNHDFVYVDKLSSNSSNLAKSLNECINKLDKNRRKFFINTFYELIIKVNIYEFRDFKYNISMFKNSVLLAYPSWNSLKEEEKNDMINIMVLIGKTIIKNHLVKAA